MPALPARHELVAAAPDLVLSAGIVAVLLAPLLARRIARACFVVAWLTLALAILAVPLAARAIGVESPLWHGMIVLDPLALSWKAILLLFTAGVLLLWWATQSDRAGPTDTAEFLLLLLGATLGLSLLGGTDNLLMILLSLELSSFAGYILAGYRKASRRSAEASLKYVVFGATSAGLTAYGLSLLYGITGTLDLSAGAMALHAHGGSPLLAVALACVGVGVAFKIAAVPLHVWCPDAFEGAGNEVALYLSVASKGAALVLAARLIDAMALSASSTAAALPVAAGVIGALSATVGNLGAFPQVSLRRLLAYSSIAHAGYMLCALALPAAGGDAAPAMLLYLAVYLFMNLGAFSVAAAVERREGSGHIAALSGLSRKAPLLAGAMAVCLLSLIGLPPLAGFMVKFNIMALLGAAGGWLWLLVAAVAINTVVSIYYYAKLIGLMYLQAPVPAPISAQPTFPQPAEPAPADARRLPSPGEAAPFTTAQRLAVSGLAAVSAAMLVVIFLAFGPLSDLSRRAGAIDPGVDRTASAAR